MRTVLIHVTDASRLDVETVLTARYSREGHQWVCRRADDPVLHIGIAPERDMSAVSDETALVRRFGAQVTTVIADISGRHPGDAEVHELVELLLSRFEGVAQDDYTSTLWSLQDIREDRTAEGHPFFDYVGWYEDLPR